MTNFIMVPVPEDRVQEIYEVLASPPGGKPPVVPPVSGSDEWSDDEIRRAYRESKTHMKTVLDQLAARPGEKVRSDQLYNELGLTSHQFSGVMGSFGKRVQNRYGKSRWFFDGDWDNETELVVYTMTGDVANTILSEA